MTLSWKSVRDETEMLTTRNQVHPAESIEHLETSEICSINATSSSRSGIDESTGEEFYVYVDLAQHMERLRIGQFLGEVMENIKRWKYLAEGDAHSLGQWILTFKPVPRPQQQEIAKILVKEHIDGFSLGQLTEDLWVNGLELQLQDFLLIHCVYLGWTGQWRQLVPVPPGSHPCVVAGIAADLSKCSIEMTQRLIREDRLASRTGVGLFYGQLVVLGYKEYHHKGSGWLPMGPNNEKLVMKRKKIPNGLQFSQAYYGSRATTPETSGNGSIEMTIPESLKAVFSLGSKGSCNVESAERNSAVINSKITFEFIPDPTRDMFQVGRLNDTGVNDFVVRGPLHSDTKGALCGPVSRLACRIVCNRLHPFRCFIYAGGFNSTKTMHISPSNVFQAEADDSINDSQTKFSALDALSSSGIKILHPDSDTWLQVSVMGRVSPLRKSGQSSSSSSSESVHSNELRNGTLVDLNGVVLLYQSPAAMAAQIVSSPHPDEVIRVMNSTRPQCPVLLQSIQFSHLSNRERALREYRRLEAVGIGFVPTGPFHIPQTDLVDVTSEQRPYVYPACGHVHGYHSSLVGRPCPLCRRTGPFVPIAFPFEPAICFGKPTHVFNPCGHAASEETCKKWANILIYETDPQGEQQHAQCPFCATILESSRELGGPFNRMILQTEMSLESVEPMNNRKASVSQLLQNSDDSSFTLTKDVAGAEAKVGVILLQRDLIRRKREGRLKYRLLGAADSSTSASTSRRSPGRISIAYPSFPKYAPQLQRDLSNDDSMEDDIFNPIDR